MSSSNQKYWKDMFAYNRSKVEWLGEYNPNAQKPNPDDYFMTHRYEGFYALAINEDDKITCFKIKSTNKQDAVSEATEYCIKNNLAFKFVHPILDTNNNSQFTDTESSVRKKVSIISKRNNEKGIGKDNSSYVYFVKDPTNNYIKIGVTKNVKSRLSTLQISFPEKLELIKYVQGDMNKERELHDTFSEFRRSGEWFEANKILLEYIDSL